MSKKHWSLMLMTSLALAASHAVLAAETPMPSRAEMGPPPVYGSQLMTDKERTQYRARMWAAQTPEERERIRSEHHEEMQRRAQAQGITLPDEPRHQRMMNERRHRMMDQDCMAASAPCDRPMHRRGPRYDKR
ncbi:MAG TPA: hypothetical protein VEQ09_08765 [Aquabacterium sp.]|nr:hypothetical protein [Aquabacterium sp.]